MIRDDLYWLALTIYQEAQGEPDDGKVAVAWVIVNRCSAARKSVSDIVLAPYQFSCWNTTSPTRMSVDVPEDSAVYRQCYRAACAAYFGLLPDPTHGANSYFNPAVVARPKWARVEQRLTTISHHEFYRV